MSAISPFHLREEPTHIEVELEPDVVDAEWARIEEFGSEVVSSIKQRKKPACLIDLTPLNYMGSALVALIVRIWKVVKAEQGKMIVVCPHPVVQQVISLAGLDKVWRVVPLRETALKEIGAPLDKKPVAQPQGLMGESAPASQPPSGSMSILWPIIGVITVIAVISILVLKTLNEAS